MDGNEVKRRLPKSARTPEAFQSRRITERSLAIIETINRYRLLTSSDLIRLVGGNEDVTYRHLQQLYHLDLIGRMAVPHETNGEFVYFLDNPTGLRELVQRTGTWLGALDFTLIRLNRAKYGSGKLPENGSGGTALFLKHELMISRFRAALEMEAARSGGRVVLEEWRQGPELWDTVRAPRLAGARGTLPHRPDAYFTLRFPTSPEGQQRSHFFYEADRATSNCTRFRMKMAAYLSFFLQGDYARKYHARKVRAVLVETTSANWLAQLRRTSGDLTQEQPLAGPLFWFTTAGLVREKSPFSPLWVCAGDERERSVLD